MHQKISANAKMGRTKANRRMKLTWQCFITPGNCFYFTTTIETMFAILGTIMQDLEQGVTAT